MVPRFPVPGLARQFGTDFHTLTCRRWRGGPTVAERAVALDRLAGSLFLAVVLLGSVWVADRAGLLTLPAVAESAQASSRELAAESAPAERPLNAAEVRQVQRNLKALGFDPGPVDGVAGRRTLSALNAYLASAGQGTALKVTHASAAGLLQ